MRKLSLAALAVCAVVVFAACGEKKFRGYKQTESGLYYKITKENKSGKQPQEGDYLYFVASFDADFDSTIVFEPKDMEGPLEASIFKGDVFEAYSLLREGEEGEFYIKADSFFLYMVGGMPPTIKPEDMLHFKIKMKEVKAKDVYEQEMAVKEQEYLEMAEKNKAEEKEVLEKYIAEQKISAKPTASGLYYIETLKGKGVKAENGKKVKVHYTGKLLDGTVFDSSVERGEPMEFVLGGGMIPGFTEGILLMKEGGKAKLVIPSALAYGERGAGQLIPPFSPILFEVELLEVSNAEPAVPAMNPLQ
jgi:FKBP-type peptidyl-prolyl cis-trans isomerase